MYQQLSLKENCVSLRSPPADTREGETTFSQIHNSRCSVLHTTVFWECRWKFYLNLHTKMSSKCQHSHQQWLFFSQFFALCWTFSIWFSSSSYLLRVCERRLLPECSHTSLLGGPRVAEDREPETGQSRRGDGACCDVKYWRYMERNTCMIHVNRDFHLFSWQYLLCTEGFSCLSVLLPRLLHFYPFFLPTLVPVERRLLQPSDCVYSESLTPQGKLVACRRDVTEILVCTVNKHCSSHAPLFKCIDLDRGRRCCSQIQSAPLVSLMIILAFVVFDIGVFLWSIIWLHQAWK